MKIREAAEKIQEYMVRNDGGVCPAGESCDLCEIEVAHIALIVEEACKEVALYYENEIISWSIGEREK